MVTRPLDGKLVQHAPDVQRRLLGRLLTAWRRESYIAEEETVETASIESA